MTVKPPKKASLSEAGNTTPLNPSAPQSRGGLLALFESTTIQEQTQALQVLELSLDAIDHNPNQARQAFDPDGLNELADSIREHGVIEPIIVRPFGDRYQIIAGERRYRASLLAEQSHIPARVMELDDAQAVIITAIENLQREDLDIEDEARQFSAIISATGMSQRQLARALGKDHLYVSRRVKLLQRPDLMEEYRSGRMKLHEAVSAVDLVPVEPVGETGPRTGSPGTTSVGEDGSVGTNDADYELVEREDLPGYLVVRGHDNSPLSTARRFRWRPAMQFRNWLDRINPSEVPDEERATFRAQISEIKSRLDEWEKALDLEEPPLSAPPQMGEDTS